MFQALHVLLLSLVSTAISTKCAAKATQWLAPEIKSAVKRAPIQLSEEEEESPVVPLKSAVKKEAPLMSAPVVTEWEKLLSDFCLLLVGFATCKVFLLLRRSAPKHHPAANRPAQSMRAQEAPLRRAFQSGGIEGMKVSLPLGTNKNAADAKVKETLVTASRTGNNIGCESVSSLDQEATTDALGFPDVSPNMLMDLTPNAVPLHSTPNAELSEFSPTVKFPSLLNSRKPLGKKVHSLSQEALLSV